MYIPSSPRGPRPIAKSIAVTCILAICVGASLASSPPSSPVEAAIGWQEWDEPRSGAEVVFTFLDLEAASND